MYSHFQPFSAYSGPFQNLPDYVILSRHIQASSRTFLLIPSYSKQLEGTARYAGILLAPAEGFSFWPRICFWAQKELFTLFVLILGHFWCSVVICVIFRKKFKHSNVLKKINLKISKKKVKKKKNL